MNKSLTEYYIDKYGVLSTAKANFEEDTTVAIHIAMLEMHEEALKNRIMRLSEEDEWQPLLLLASCLGLL